MKKTVSPPPPMAPPFSRTYVDYSGCPTCGDSHFLTGERPQGKLSAWYNGSHSHIHITRQIPTTPNKDTQ